MFVAKTSVVSVTTEQIAVQLFCNLLFLKGTLESRTLHSPAFFRIEICSAREKKNFSKGNRNWNDIEKSQYYL